jgi:DNA-binding response OmpR family regulator
LHSILLIDKPHGAAYLTRLMLEQSGYGVTLAPHVYAAKALLDNTRYDLILLDLIIPQGNGLELLRQLKEGPNWRTPVIVVSGLKQPRVIHASLELGAREYIVRPFDPAYLLERVAFRLEPDQAVPKPVLRVA